MSLHCGMREVEMEKRDILKNPELAVSSSVARALYALSDTGEKRIKAVGRSHGGLPILSLEVGSMDNPVLFVGGTHGMEWPSVLCVLRLAAECCRSFDEGTPLCGIDFKKEFGRCGAVFLPLLNPDGFDIRRLGALAPAAKRFRLDRRFGFKELSRWQANARGVDLNRNFPAGFSNAKRAAQSLGISSPAPTRYGGPFPLSERETRAAVMMCERLRPRALYTLHSQGEEIYWRYGERTPSQSRYIAHTLSSLCGYAVTEPSPVASHAGFKDWFIRRFSRPAFTLELGRGKNPLDYDCFERIWQRVCRALLVAAIM